MNGRRPVITFALLSVIVLLFLGMEFTGGSERIPNLLRFGALSAPHVERGEYWRLVTPLFLHIGWLHLLFNGYALLQLGMMCESLFGGARFLALFLACGVGGTAASVWLNRGAISAGASGAIFGLAGVIVAAAWSGRTHIAPFVRRALLQGIVPFIGYNLLFGFISPRIDNMGHLGGLMTGFAIGWILPLGRGWFITRAGLVLLAVAVMGWAGVRQCQVARGVDVHQVEGDTTFVVELHNAVSRVAEKLGRGVAAKDVPKLVEELETYRQKLALQFTMPQLADERRAVGEILDQIVAALRAAPNGANRKALEVAMARFYAWSDRMVEWAAKQGYEISPADR